MSLPVLSKLRALADDFARKDREELARCGVDSTKAPAEPRTWRRPPSPARPAPGRAND